MAFQVRDGRCRLSGRAGSISLVITKNARARFVRRRVARGSTAQVARQPDSGGCPASWRSLWADRCGFRVVSHQSPSLVAEVVRSEAADDTLRDAAPGCVSGTSGRSLPARDHASMAKPELRAIRSHACAEVCGIPGQAGRPRLQYPLSAWQKELRRGRVVVTNQALGPPWCEHLLPRLRALRHPVVDERLATDVADQSRHVANDQERSVRRRR